MPERVPHPSGNRLAYGRGIDNPIGLKLAFTWDGKTAKAEFTPNDLHHGWPGIAHGGIILALMDEAAGSAASFSRLSCVSARVKVKLKYPAVIGEKLIVTSSVREVRRRIVVTDNSICNETGKEIASGEITLMIIEPKNIMNGKTDASK